MTSKIKYVLCPGHVRSRNDGDVHFISAGVLARLYGVSIRQCVVQPDIGRPEHRGFTPPENTTYLRPRHDGDYRLPVIVATKGGWLIAAKLVKETVPAWIVEYTDEPGRQQHIIKGDQRTSVFSNTAEAEEWMEKGHEQQNERQL